MRSVEHVCEGDSAGVVLPGPWGGVEPHHARGLLEELVIRAGRGEISGVRVQVRRKDGTWENYAAV
jgi:hypothetical protein